MAVGASRIRVPCGSTRYGCWRWNRWPGSSLLAQIRMLQQWEPCRPPAPSHRRGVTWNRWLGGVVPCCGLMSEERCAAQRAGRVQALQLSTHVARRWPPLPAMQITHAQLDALAAFYGEEFGAPGERTFCRYLSRPANTHAVHGCRVPLGLSHAGCCGNACMLRHPGSWDTPGAHRMPLPVWLHLQAVCSGTKPSPTSSPRTRSLDRSW